MFTFSVESAFYNKPLVDRCEHLTHDQDDSYIPQMLTIHLAEKRDEVDCLSAWVSAKEANFPTQDGVDLKSK